MKKIIFGIFAHPDDEAFGPCGTLIKEVQDGAELHLITLTSGEAGSNPDNYPDLGKVRDAEWRDAGKKIGAFGMYNLKLRDGRLNNITMQRASEHVLKIVGDIISSHKVPVTAEIITYDLGGISGHIDHIVAARLATFVFYRLKDADMPMTRLRYFTISEALLPKPRTDWLYAEKGCSPDDIDETVDARYLREQIIDAMQSHTTQRDDYNYLLDLKKDQLGIEHFLVIT